MAKSKKTVAVDFDGVINSYKSGWVAPDNIPDPPVDGAIEFLKQLLDEFDVAVLSTRCQYAEAIEAMKQYLIDNGMTEEEVEKIEFTQKKIPAILYIDDRAFLFKGKFPSIDDIKNFKPWYEDG